MRMINGVSKQQGVTLVELVISIVIISIAMVAMMSSFSLSMSHSADPLWRNKALKLGQLYLDEILAKKYAELSPIGGLPFVESSDSGCANLGPDGTETRATYDDVDDYHGITDSVPTSLTAPLDSSYDDYRIDITVACDGDDVGALAEAGGDDNSHAKIITVTVTPPNQSPITFAAYKGNY
jgi:MSHA pilin protein MshD